MIRPQHNGAKKDKDEEERGTATAPLTPPPSHAHSGGGGGGGASNGAAAASLQAVFLQPIEHLSSKAKAGLVGIAAVTTLIVYLVASIISRDNATFPIGPLYAGQIAGFWVCTCAIVWYLVIMLAVLRDVVVDGEDRIAATAKYVNEEQHAQLSAAAEFAAYILLFYLCDRTTYVPRSKKKYDRDLFWSLWALLCVAGLATLRRAKPPREQPPPVVVATSATSVGDMGATAGPSTGSETVIVTASAPAAAHEAPLLAKEPSAPATFHVKHLQRDQTEEWKGWMQVMFLWYHYFNAKDIYNAIRLYIAAYVWMTGFGNFSYYYIRRDFSLARFCQMQWRLNFMVVITCAVLGNEYMLYYICMLHTTFTLIIYCLLGVQSQLNTSFHGICIKFAACVAVAVVMWDIDGVFEAVWSPLTWLVQYHDPYKPERPLLHEWQFRSHLDHLIWIVGMWMAYNHPRFDSYLEALDRMPARVGNTIKCTIFAACIAGFYVYNETVFSLSKKDYNRMHPYTSFIPIVLFIIMRNIFTTFRMYHIHLFEFLGKTTLETYIAQFHIWMATTGANGSPKFLLRILPEGWPIMNFLVISVIFFFITYRLFQTTNTIRTFVMPNKAPNAVLQRNVIYLFAAVVAVYLGSVAMRSAIQGSAF